MILNLIKHKYSILLNSLFVACLALCLPLDLHAGDYLTGTEIIAIGAASTGIGFLGMTVKKNSKGKKPLIRGHLAFEEGFQHWLGGDCKVGKRNFLDDHTGSAITPIVTGILLTTANLSYPQGDKNKDAAQDLFLFLGGIITTKGVTDISKGIFARRRPFHCILGDSTGVFSKHEHSRPQDSFFSGHASSAFFSSAFLNLRVRSIMRQRMSASEYNNWKWGSSGILFSWASIVGLSRVQAYKHHLSDVIVGAAVGILLAELFYSFNNYSNDKTGEEIPLQLLKLTFSF